MVIICVPVRWLNPPLMFADVVMVLAVFAVIGRSCLSKLLERLKFVSTTLPLFTQAGKVPLCLLNLIADLVLLNTG